MRALLNSVEQGLPSDPGPLLEIAVDVILPFPKDALRQIRGQVTGTLAGLGDLRLPPTRADVAIAYDDALARTGAKVRDVGDLREGVAIDTVDATGLFLHPDLTALTVEQGTVWLRIGAPASIDVRRGADPTSGLVRRVGVTAEP